MDLRGLSGVVGGVGVVKLQEWLESKDHVSVSRMIPLKLEKALGLDHKLADQN